MYIDTNPNIFGTNLVKSLTGFVLYKTISSHTSKNIVILRTKLVKINKNLVQFMTNQVIYFKPNQSYDKLSHLLDKSRNIMIKFSQIYYSYTHI